LDGGHLMYYMAEIVKGSPFREDHGDRTTDWYCTLVDANGICFYNDINRLITS